MPGLSNTSAARRALIEHVAVFAGFVAFYLVFFSPVLPSGRLLAPGDGANSYLPSVLREWSLWTDLILAGYPAFADPQFLTWYPLRLLGGHYNALVVSAYVIASFSVYGYARLITGSIIAGLVAGVIYGCGGFMTAHLGHLTIIHSAAWVPLTLWGLELLKRHDRWRPAAVVAAGVALSCLGGHPQPWVYGLLLSGTYVVWQSTTIDERRLRIDWRYVWRAGVAISIGLLIAAVQLIPLAEFSGLTARGQWTFADFTSYALPPDHLLLMVFPNLFGNVVGFYPFVDAWAHTELTFYAGVTPLLLALLGAWQPRLRGFVVFWAFAGLLALIYMLGDATPLARIAFHAPVIGHFRASARAGMIFIMAVAMLAAVGTAALQREWISGRRLWWALCTAFLSFVATLIVVSIQYKALVATAQSNGISIPTMPRNPAIWLPCLFAMAAVALIFWTARRRTRVPAVLLLLVVVIDVASFGWLSEWRIATVDPSIKNAAPGWQSIIQASRRDYGRILPMDGVWSPGPAKPNVNLIFGLASASGYGPLLPSRYADVTGISATGVFGTPVPESLIWPLLGVRWLMSASPGEVVLGSGCGVDDAQPEIRLHLPKAIDVAAVRIDSHLACSTNLADDAPVIEILRDSATSPAATLLAGRDTAEWSWDSPKVRAAVRHRRATVSNSFARGPIQGHWYRGLLTLAGSDTVEHSVTLRAVLPPGVVIRVRSVSFIDRQGKETPLPLLSGTFGGSDDWAEITPPPGFAFAEEYRRYAGRAWLVGATEHLTDAQALDALQSGGMPNQQPFSPLQTAIVDRAASDLDDSMHAPGPAGSVDAERLSPDHWRFHVHALRPAMMVMNQIDYPGWQARVNGAAAKVVRTDYAFQGIAVPSGESEVDLRFRPRSLLIGDWLSGLGLLLWLLCVIEPSYKLRKKPA